MAETSLEDPKVSLGKTTPTPEVNKKTATKESDAFLQDQHAINVASQDGFADSLTLTHLANTSGEDSPGGTGKGISLRSAELLPKGIVTIQKIIENTQGGLGNAA